MTAYGVTPAEYSTGDVVKQKIIENSDHFKNGRIFFIRKTGTPDPVKTRAHRASQEQTQAQDEPVKEEPKPTSEPEKDVAEVRSDMEMDPIIEQPVDVVEDISPQKVTVSCLTDAQNYLRDNYGIPTSKSRSKEKAQAYARENGIVFIGL